MFARLQEVARQEKANTTHPSVWTNSSCCNFVNEDSLICKTGRGGGILSVDIKVKKGLQKQAVADAAVKVSGRL